jgi:hypothetical protein
VVWNWPLASAAFIFFEPSSSGWRRGRKPIGGVDRGSNKTEIHLICLGMATREAEMQRLALALVVTAITLCCGSVTRAQVATAFYPAGPTVCQPLPSWYPRGWELMVRYPCVTYLYGASYYPAARYPYSGAYPYRRVSTHAVQGVHRRPYLRPGWWW